MSLIFIQKKRAAGTSVDFFFGQTPSRKVSRSREA